MEIGGTLDLSFSRDGSEVIVSAAGEIEASKVPELQRALTGLIDELGNLFVRLDLQGVSFLDASALEVLSGASARLRAKGGRLAVSGARPEVATLLRIAGLGGMLVRDPVRARAVAAPA